MLIDELRFRQLCQTPDGSIESRKFQAALDQSKDDPVPVTFDVGLGQTKTIKMSRQECEFYAKIAHEENAAEDKLIECLNPKMRPWALNNRDKMRQKLIDSIDVMKENEKVPGQGVVLVWPLCPPDQVDEEVANNYLRKYGN